MRDANFQARISVKILIIRIWENVLEEVSADFTCDMSDKVIPVRHGASGKPHPTRENRICGFQLARAMLKIAIWLEELGDYHTSDTVCSSQ